MDEFSRSWMEKVESAISVGTRLIDSDEDFDSACDHVYGLLRDASCLLESGSHATAGFLALTAMEESIKIHIGMYRKSSDPVQRNKDPLFNHKLKHHLAAKPTIAIGERLPRAIGESRMKELLANAARGDLVKLRETALYNENSGGGLKTPAGQLTKQSACELLLLAIESFDDSLVGYTGHSFVLGKLTDAIFQKWETPN